MDYYINDDNVYNRLMDEWKKYGKLIIAFDYDNTVFDYSNKNNQCSDVIELLQECKRHGFHMIVFTSCNADRIPEIESYLQAKNIPYDAINETPEYIPFQGRKVYYNLLLDDRAGLSSAAKVLWRVLYTIRGYKATDNIQDVG